MNPSFPIFIKNDSSDEYEELTVTFTFHYDAYDGHFTGHPDDWEPGYEDFEVEDVMINGISGIEHTLHMAYDEDGDLINEEDMNNLFYEAAMDAIKAENVYHAEDAAENEYHDRYGY